MVEHTRLIIKLDINWSMKNFPTLRKTSDFVLKFLKICELDYSKIIKLSVQLKNGVYLTEDLQISIYPYSPEKVPFSSLILWVNLIFPTRKLPHKADFSKIIYLSVQIKLDKKVHLLFSEYKTNYLIDF